MSRNKRELPFIYFYKWGNSPFRATLKGRKCKVIERGIEDKVVLEFENGQQVVSSSMAIKRVYK